MRRTKHLCTAVLLMAALLFLCASGKDVYAGSAFSWDKSSKLLIGEANYSASGVSIKDGQWMRFENGSCEVLNFKVTLTETTGKSISWALINRNLNPLHPENRVNTGNGSIRYVHISPGEDALVYIQGESGALFNISIESKALDFGGDVPGNGTGKADTANLTLYDSGCIQGTAFRVGDGDSRNRTMYMYNFTTARKIDLTLQETLSYTKVGLDQPENVIIDHSTHPKTVTVSAGAHTLYVVPDRFRDYNIKYTAELNNPATDVAFPSLPASAVRGEKINITVQTVPADSGSTITRVKVDGKDQTIPTGQNQVTLPYTISGSGSVKVEAYTDNDKYKETRVYIAPDVPALNYSGFSTTHNTVTYSKPADYQAQIMIGGKWVNYSGSQGGLAPNTAYPVRVRAFAGSPVGTLYSAWSAPVTLRTNTNKLPAIKSVKISKAKVKKTKTLVNGSYKTSYRTTFKVTVKLKKKPGAAGILINGIRCPGNKKTYSYSTSLPGKVKGKKTRLTIAFYNNTGWTNQGVTKTYKVKIK